MSETPETTDAAPEPETPGEAGGDAAQSPEAVPGATRRERAAQRRAARRPAQRGPLTPEERDAERRARRAQVAAERRRYRARLKAKRAQARETAPPVEPAHAPEHGPGRPRVRQGIVISDKPDKTIVVRIDDARRHRRYRKILRTSTSLHAHDERNDAHAGDTVRVVESRPLSATKRWRLLDVVERAR
jgi:small subunit ribosomal protein S17